MKHSYLHTSARYFTILLFRKLRSWLLGEYFNASQSHQRAQIDYSIFTGIVLGRVSLFFESKCKKKPQSTKEKEKPYKYLNPLSFPVLLFSFSTAEKKLHPFSYFVGDKSPDQNIDHLIPIVGSNTENPVTESFAEVDPTGRYGRYNELLGSGAVKKVYRAFDQEEGIEVAWNQVKLRNFSDDEAMINRLYSEVRLLRNLKHEKIITLHSVWRDKERNMLNFITEVCTSGNLREYRKKHKHVSMKALKKWSKQILKGLEYLHTHEPCVIHRDLNCSNVFINGNIGQVKIGDLGLAATVGKNHSAHSLLGTPEFMAPELYDENYTELIDIYSFGMCLLEMVTLELPYNECDNVAQIYRKVTSGVRPLAMNKVKDPEVKAFIEKCLAQPRARPSAFDLLKDPFFDGINYGDDANADDRSSR